MKNYLKNIKFTEPIENLHCIQYPSHYLCVASFMRIQEFYESPDDSIRDKYFTLEQMMDSSGIYQKRQFNKSENFTYFEDWGGFNVPYWTVVDFYKKFKNSLSYKESYIFDVLDKKVYNWQKEKFYLIAISKKRDYYNHELSHGLYCLFDDYREEMDQLIDECSYRKSLVNMLRKDGYAERSIADEIQAYLSTSSDDYLRTTCGIQNPNKVSRPFKKVFRKYKQKHAQK